MKTILLSMTLFTLTTFTSFAQNVAVFSENGKAIRGYDPVAYFTDGQPVKGDSTLTYKYDGTIWQFASQAHLDAFKADPAKYMPQYGGYCAYGTSQGHKSPTQPEAWTIEDGKLYLNYNAKVKTLWNKDKSGYIEKANTNWPALKEKDTH